MKKFCYLPAILVLAAACATGAETYVLAKKDHLPAPGTKIEGTEKSILSNGTIKFTIQGKEMEGACSFNESETESLTFAANKITHLLSASSKKRLMTINGQEMPEDTPPAALLNVPVTLTKADGKWTAAIGGGVEPTEEQKTELEKHEKNANRDEDLAMYGSEPRAIGDTWVVDAKDLSFTHNAVDTTGGMKFTFKGIEDFDGRKCARLEGAVELAGKTDGAKGGQKIALKGNVVVLRSLEDLHDLKVEMTGKMEMTGDIPNGTMAMSGDMKMEQTAKITK